MPFAIDKDVVYRLAQLITNSAPRPLFRLRRTRISASNAARGRNSPIKAHQINL
jgi:hypothetical protein